jgi:hypothetical protein
MERQNMPLGELANWYAQERKYRENRLNLEEKLARRQEDIKLGFDFFKEWVETQHKNIFTKEPSAGHCTMPSTNYL